MTNGKAGASYYIERAQNISFIVMATAVECCAQLPRAWRCSDWLQIWFCKVWLVKTRLDFSF